jgi:hypothetical protein
MRILRSVAAVVREKLVARDFKPPIVQIGTGGSRIADGAEYKIFPRASVRIGEDVSVSLRWIQRVRVLNVIIVYPSLFLFLEIFA